ncbi:hypothetical protein LCGC14_0325730 [marine sediment metagenome]|uniref:Phage virion morphogenesis protein n=1 Tax=marine sediment metagenome TaxID=412755 RepID=A0A0F9U0H6_9ZZZZ
MNLEEFQGKVERIAASFGEENTEALERCDVVLQAGIEDNFRQSRTARGEAWPLRKDPKPTHPLLIMDGDLLVAAIYSVGTVSDGKVLTKIMPEGPTGTSRAGIRRHEFGDATRRQNLSAALRIYAGDKEVGSPGILARPYFGVSEESADKCAEIVADALIEQVALGL